MMLGRDTTQTARSLLLIALSTLASGCSLLTGAFMGPAATAELITLPVSPMPTPPYLLLNEIGGNDFADDRHFHASYPRLSALVLTPFNVVAAATGGLTPSIVYLENDSGGFLHLSMRGVCAFDACWPKLHDDRPVTREREQRGDVATAQ